MRRIVLDTNVLVSALLLLESPPARVLKQWRDGEWQMAISGAILEEYGRVLCRPKFRLPRSLVKDTLELIRRRALLVIPLRHFNVIAEDPSDNEFLDVAIEAEAEALVSGDQHLLSRKTFRGIPILSPAVFIAEGKN